MSNAGLQGWPNRASLSAPYINIQDQKANNTAGGTFTAGSWQTRTLNTIMVDTAGLATLATNQITLPAGWWRCRITAPAYRVGRHQLRLRSITDALTVLVGTSAYAGTGTEVVTESTITGRFRLDVRTVLEVQHQGQATSATLGFGVEAGSIFTVDREVYAVAEFWKEN